VFRSASRSQLAISRQVFTEVLPVDEKRPTCLCGQPRALPESGEQVVVCLMCADPEPMKDLTFSVGNDTVRAPHLRGSNFAFLLERQGWMKWILFE
jgi:hypothetical protein